jgi:acetoin utilization deacetylase AcuC-like enzyme
MYPIWYSDIYTTGLDPTIRFPRERYCMLYKMLTAYHDRKICFLEPEPMDKKFLYGAHQRDYVDRFLRNRLTSSEKRRIGLRPWTDNIQDRTLRITNGTLLATKYVWEHGGFAGNLSGGTHHAHYDYGSGYCIFNDIAVSSRFLLDNTDCVSILILDLDVHQGDGTATIFSEDPTVFTFSMHCQSNFPLHHQRSDWDIPLPIGCKDDDYLQHLKVALQKLREKKFEFLFFQAGVDALDSDRLGKLSLTRRGLQRRNEMVFDFAKSQNIPTVVMMGGGYAEPLMESTEAHFDVYSLFMLEG